MNLLVFELFVELSLGKHVGHKSRVLSEVAEVGNKHESGAVIEQVTGKGNQADGLGTKILAQKVKEIGSQLQSSFETILKVVYIFF